MRRHRWGPGGPPPDAYSRVTNPERFAPLHPFAAELLKQTEARFKAERWERVGLDPELEGSDPAHSTVRLVPADARAAPITVAFSRFPGVRVRAGRWYRTSFPVCGCDACDETLDENLQHLESLVHRVTAGGLREELWLPNVGDGWLVVDWGGAHSRRRLSSDLARQMLSRWQERSVVWEAWPQRRN
jgi:Family of unknown function (DUF6226)